MELRSRKRKSTDTADALTASQGTEEVPKPNQQKKRAKKGSASAKAGATKAPAGRAAAAAGGASTSAPSSDAPIQINRAPVLKLWATVVSQREGYAWTEALTYGSWIAGVLAHSKGKSLGLYEDKERSEEEIEARHERDRRLGMQKVEAFGMKIPTVDVDGERHAVSEGKAITPSSVEGSLRRAFGQRLQDVKAAMQALAASVPEAELGKRAYHLYEQLRPEWHGWGQKAELSLTKIRELAQQGAT